MLFVGCEKTIPLDIDDIEKRVVVNSLFYADSAFEVELTHSAQIAAGQHTGPIQNAVVRLFENGEMVEELQELGMGKYSSTRKAKAGAVYTLDVNTSLGHVSASSGVPDRVNVVKFDSVEISNLVLDSWIGPEIVYNLKLTFIDPVEDNYYLLRIVVYNTIDGHIYQYKPGGLFYRETDYMSHENGLDGETFINTYIYLKFPDVEFNNTEKTYSFGFNPNSYGTSTLYTLEVYSLDKHFYDFIHTLDLYEWVMYDFFSEPINVHSNVDGGIGIFAGASVVKLPLKINYDAFYNK